MRRRIGLDRPRASIGWTTVDTCPWLTPFVVLGLVAGAGMAVFGFPPFGVHGPLHRLGVMDPLCGMTRAVVALRLDPARAWAYNPGVFVLLPVAAVALARGVVGSATGRWLVVRLRASRGLLIAVAVLVVLLWSNQQHHAALLMRG